MNKSLKILPTDRLLGTYNKINNMQEKYNKQRNLILYTISKFGQKGISKIKLMKLLFLIDRELAYRGKDPLFTWKIWKYGPLSFDALDIIDELIVEGYVQVKEWTEKGRKRKAYTTTMRFLPATLDRDVVSIVDEVVSKWRNKPLDELLSYIYNLEEVKDKWPGATVVFKHDNNRDA